MVVYTREKDSIVESEAHQIGAFLAAILSRRAS
jgi:hypothetical protein